MQLTHMHPAAPILSHTYPAAAPFDLYVTIVLHHHSSAHMHKPLLTAGGHGVGALHIPQRRTLIRLTYAGRGVPALRWAVWRFVVT